MLNMIILLLHSFHSLDSLDRSIEVSPSDNVSDVEKLSILHPR